jgi:hypothetical protein
MIAPMGGIGIVVVAGMRREMVGMGAWWKGLGSRMGTWSKGGGMVGLGFGLVDAIDLSQVVIGRSVDRTYSR